MVNQVIYHIPVKIIKNPTSLLAQHFNYLIKIGKFPDDLKTDRITPIYKKYNTELLDNYRPISTLPIFGKLFGKIIYSRLYSFFVSQNLLHERQFGFRKNHSTSHAINYSINHINNSLKKNMCLRSLLILAKHSTLVCKIPLLARRTRPKG